MSAAALGIRGPMSLRVAASRHPSGIRSIASASEMDFYRSRYGAIVDKAMAGAAPLPVSPASATLTVSEFPSMEPVATASYPAPMLLARVRNDLLHRAVRYELDYNRVSHAKQLNRVDVKGSGRKLYQQKGTGRARVGDSRAPNRRGGGVVFPVQPRSFRHGLPKQMYTQALGMALALRWQRGELFVVNADAFTLPEPDGEQLDHVLQTLRWSREFGMTTFVPAGQGDSNFAAACAANATQTAWVPVDKTLVTNLLKGSRVVIEQPALNALQARLGL